MGCSVSGIPQRSEDKSKSLDLSTKREMVDVQAVNDTKSLPSLSCQHELLGISRSYNYYAPIVNQTKEDIKRRLIEIAEDDFMCVDGEEKVYRQLLQEGYSISLNTVSKYRKELGIKAILAVKPITTTVSDDKHPKYPYMLKDIDINKPNIVWSTDITYIKINGGTVYLAAVIDWHSCSEAEFRNEVRTKAVLSWNISNTMDTDFVMGVLDDALLKYPKPDIFNTDQGSRPSFATTPQTESRGQYTSYIHTKRLKDSGIKISMDSKGRATDNIAIERLSRSVKCKRIYLNEYQNMQKLKDDLQNYFHFYNYYRFHQTLKYKRPMEVYDEQKYLNTIKRNETMNNIQMSQKVA